MVDCVIIGAGLIGMLTARELAAAGLTVTLLERGEVGRESSWAGGGIISPLYPWRYDDAVSRLAQWSQKRYEQLCGELQQESGVDSEYTRSGLLILGNSELPQAQCWAERFDVRLENISASETGVTEPRITPSAEAIWMPEVAQVRNPRLVRALQESLITHPQVHIETHTEVARILHQKGRVTGVEVGRGAQLSVVSAERVMVAGGAWSGRIMADLGVQMEVAPVRGQMILFRAEPGVLQHIVLHHDRYLIPRRDGRILAGSTLEYTGFEKETTTEALDALRAFALGILPALRDYPVEHHWAGLRPGSPAGIPYISAHPEIDGLYVNAGHFRNGVVLGPASAHVVASLITGMEPDIDPMPYGLRRHGNV